MSICVFSIMVYVYISRVTFACKMCVRFGTNAIEATFFYHLLLIRLNLGQFLKLM